MSIYSYRYNQKALSIGGEKSVHFGICDQNQLHVVIKFLKVPYTIADKERLRIEINRTLLAKTTAGNRVSSIIDWDMEHVPPFYVEEYFPEGTLAEKMQLVFSRNKVFSEKNALKQVREILFGLKGIHNSKQIHRDVKPSNILLKGDGLVITDMGLGRTIDKPTTLQTKFFCGTLGYASPEQLSAGLNPFVGVDQTSDLYSIGVILHEMLTGQRGAWDNIKYKKNLHIYNFLTKMLAFDKNKRFQDASSAINRINLILRTL